MSAMAILTPFLSGGLAGAFAASCINYYLPKHKIKQLSKKLKFVVEKKNA
jgi:hypothetical protein